MITSEFLRQKIDTYLYRIKIIEPKSWIEVIESAEPQSAPALPFHLTAC